VRATASVVAGHGTSLEGELGPTCMYSKLHLFSLISVGYHSELPVVINFYQHYHFLPTLSYIIFLGICAYYLLMLFGLKMINILNEKF
jgi:hypothetical protein